MNIPDGNSIMYAMIACSQTTMGWGGGGEGSIALQGKPQKGHYTCNEY